MKNKLLPFLRRHPNLYSLTKKIYWQIKSFNTQRLGTKISEKKWASRDLSEIRVDFENLNHPHRQFLLEKISTLQPFSRILEIGCNYGPNLYLLAKRFPKTEIIGIDINPLSTSEGNRWLTQKNISNVKLLVDKTDYLNQLPNKSFDIVFTDATLMYIGPDKIKKTIQEMIRITRRAIILFEWHCENNDLYGLGAYHFGQWKRNYINLFKQFVSKKQICLTKIPKEIWLAKDWQELGYLIEVIL